MSEPNFWKPFGKPRSPHRIAPTLAAIEQLWRKYPDMRLGQLITNLAAVQQRPDPFYIEDDLLRSLSDLVREEGWQLDAE